MSRRRYLSTEISTDTRVNKLAIQAGDFAALLYTWMIPHAGDNASLPGDPEELLLIVCPGRRDKQPADIQDAVDAMVALGLMEHCANGELCFPESFFNHQTYITAKRRNPEVDLSLNAMPAHNSANQRKTPHNSAQQRKSAQNSASFKSSLTSSFKSSSTSTPPLPPSLPQQASRPPPLRLSQSRSTYETVLNGAMPRLVLLCGEIDKQLTEGWLRSTLRDVEAAVGPLPRDKLGPGLDLAFDQLRRQLTAGKVHSPRGLAKTLIVTYLRELTDGNHGTANPAS